MGASTGTRRARNGAGSVYAHVTTRGVKEWVATTPRAKGRPVFVGTCAVPAPDPRLRGKALERHMADLDAAAREQAVLRRDAKAEAAGLGVPTDAGRTTLAAYAERWLAGLKYTTLRDTTKRRYGYDVKAFCAAIGHVRLTDLRHEHVLALWEAIPTGNKRQAAHRTLVAVLKVARKRDRYPIDPALLEGERPGHAPAETPAMTAAQLGKLLRSVDDPFWHLVYRLGYVANLRESEECGLVWGDLDEVGQRIDLTHQLVAPLKGMTDAERSARVPLKNERQRRHVAIDETTLWLLAAHRKREQAAGFGKPGDWVFRNPAKKGLALSADQLYRRFKKDIAAAGLPAELRPHSARSGAAMTALEAGVNLDTVSRRLGHSRLDTTSKHYLRGSDPLDREAVEAVARRIGPG